MAFSVTSCDKPQPPPPQTQPPPQQQVAQPAQPQKTIIKGFYIGMPAAEVVAKLQGFTVQRIKGLIIAEIPSLNLEHPRSSSYFYLDSETYGNLYELKIDCFTVDMMFSSGSLNAREFADNLSEAYKLPRFDFRQKPEGGCEYKCVTQDGVKITVSGDSGHEKELGMSKSADAAIKKGFN
jgi:hypothetical protein